MLPCTQVPQAVFSLNVFRLKVRICHLSYESFYYIGTNYRAAQYISVLRKFLFRWTGVLWDTTLLYSEYLYKWKSERGNCISMCVENFIFCYIYYSQSVRMFIVLRLEAVTWRSSKLFIPLLYLTIFLACNHVVILHDLILTFKARLMSNSKTTQYSILHASSYWTKTLRPT
jgi:hypothetical protein